VRVEQQKLLQLETGTQVQTLCLTQSLQLVVEAAADHTTRLAYPEGRAAVLLREVQLMEELVLLHLFKVLMVVVLETILLEAVAVVHQPKAVSQVVGLVAPAEMDRRLASRAVR
jgi:hypothetical protein